ncbi:MAG: cellulase family glycosylhydrolase [Ruminiclostridium sp.]|nr:cellulase family glycosylhydrolase [Ruminiclostridium sp.]
MARTRKAISVTSAVVAVLFTLLLVCSMPLPASAEALTGKTAMELMTELDLGWNLGNTLDATGGNGTLESETSWGNPKTTKAMIDAVKAQGFNTMRLPVSWGSHMTNGASGYVIDSQWMARVKTIVDYAIDNGMYVILNIHHDNDIRSGDDRFFYPSETYKDQSIKFVKAVWTQISETFKNYDQHLIFETLNEPRLVGTGDEWWFPVNSPGTNVAEAISIINQMNQAAVDVIRTSGGNNADRCIMIPGYGASIDGCTTPNYQLPTDTAQNRLIVSVHAYTPYNFALNASGTSVFSDDLKSEVDYLFNTLKSSFLDKNIPVVIGEASASNKNNASERLKWVNYYMGKSASLGIPVMLWDNNVYTGSSNLGEQHGYLNRLALTWYDKDVVDAMVACYGNAPSGDNGNGGNNDNDDDDDNNVTTDSTVLFTGSASADAWAQATSVMTIKNDGGTLNPAIITEDGYFYVEYTGDIGKIELIMQSWSGGTEWAKICLSESGMAENNYYAKFSYADCVAAFGEDFATYLDCVYIGATDGSITALSLSYVTEKSAEEPEEPTLPSAVTGFGTKARGSNYITIGWDKIDSATGYIIEQYKNGAWTQIAKITSNATTSYKVTGLSAGTKYQFRMKAYKTYTSSTFYSDYVTVSDTTNS